MRTRPARVDDVETIVGLATILFAEDGGVRDPHIDVDRPRTSGCTYYEGVVADPDALVVLAEEDEQDEEDAVVGVLVGRVRPADTLRPTAVAAELEMQRHTTG